ncbi:Uncharacterised protein [Mycobacterium tuberculosis]|nr:Uncharacterised protein [Mycobacterium tuberculosis]
MYLTNTSPGPGPSRSSSISSNGLPASNSTAAVVFIVVSLSRTLWAYLAQGKNLATPAATSR